MTPEIKESMDDNAIVFDGLDEAIIGVNVHDGSLIYDEETILDILVYEQEMSEEDALEHYDYNILGMRFSELGPTIVRKW